tara:strand:+ start:5892 stop:6185 length:294 start_codon:yes stop_codon:yes gene_type:complete
MPPVVGSEKTVTSAGTAETLVASQTLVQSVTMRAKRSNTTNIFLGDSDVDSSQNDGFAPGDLIAIPAGEDGAIDLVGIWIDAATNGEGVDFWYSPFQ